MAMSLRTWCDSSPRAWVAMRIAGTLYVPFVNMRLECEWTVCADVRGGWAWGGGGRRGAARASRETRAKPQHSPQQKRSDSGVECSAARAALPATGECRVLRDRVAEGGGGGALLGSKERTESRFCAGAPWLQPFPSGFAMRKWAQDLAGPNAPPKKTRSLVQCCIRALGPGLPSWGSPERGTSKWLHHRCRLGGPHHRRWGKAEAEGPRPSGRAGEGRTRPNPFSGSETRLPKLWPELTGDQVSANTNTTAI